MAKMVALSVAAGGLPVAVVPLPVAVVALPVAVVAILVAVVALILLVIVEITNAMMVVHSVHIDDPKLAGQNQEIPVFRLMAV